MCIRDRYIATALEIYVTGSLNVFNHRSNVDINNRIVCYDIKELGKQLKDVYKRQLLYCALIGYIHYEAPVEEQNFSTLIEMINSMEVREDDEEFKNAVDLMFDELKERDPNHLSLIHI